MESEEFPNLITYNAIKTNEDIRYIYQIVNDNNETITKSVEEMKQVSF